MTSLLAGPPVDLLALYCSELEKNQKEAMANLAKTDPEFFKYLQENDKDLLEFGNESASSDEEPTPAPKKSKKGKKQATPEAEEELEALEEYEAPDTDDEDEEPDMDMGSSSKGKGKGREEPQMVTLEMLKHWQKGMVQVRSQSRELWHGKRLNLKLFRTSETVAQVASTMSVGFPSRRLQQQRVAVQQRQGSDLRLRDR